MIFLDQAVEQVKDKPSMKDKVISLEEILVGEKFGKGNEKKGGGMG
jgi:hypothetical protein